MEFIIKSDRIFNVSTFFLHGRCCEAGESLSLKYSAVVQIWKWINTLIRTLFTWLLLKSGNMEASYVCLELISNKQRTHSINLLRQLNTITLIRMSVRHRTTLFCLQSEIFYSLTRKEVCLFFWTKTAACVHIFSELLVAQHGRTPQHAQSRKLKASHRLESWQMFDWWVCGMRMSEGRERICRVL